jgi:hypothetical protein
MKRTLLFFCVFATIIVNPYAEEINHYKARVSQKIAELELDGALALWFTDADTGLPLEGAFVGIEGKGTTKTDRDGIAAFPVFPDDTYYFIFQKNGYMDLDDKFTVFGGSIFSINIRSLKGLKLII